jgi:hypothetical protein
MWTDQSLRQFIPQESRQHFKNRRVNICFRFFPPCVTHNPNNPTSSVDNKGIVSLYPLCLLIGKNREQSAPHCHTTKFICTPKQDQSEHFSMYFQFSWLYTFCCSFCVCVWKKKREERLRRRIVIVFCVWLLINVLIGGHSECYCMNVVLGLQRFIHTMSMKCLKDCCVLIVPKTVFGFAETTFRNVFVVWWVVWTGKDCFCPSQTECVCGFAEIAFRNVFVCVCVVRSCFGLEKIGVSIRQTNWVCLRLGRNHQRLQKVVLFE